jgi:thiamine biosynthesis lipoprotein ApbE
VGAGSETVLLRDEALSTSGSEEQTVLIEGTEFSHIFDPRSGRPMPGRGSLYVVTPTALEGDVLSTAIFVNGPAWAKRFGANRPELSWLFEPVESPPESGGPRIGARLSNAV